MFPSSLSANTVRVQSIFSRHYHVEPAPSSGGTRAAAQQAQKEQQTEPEAEKTDEQEVSFGRLTAPVQLDLLVAVRVGPTRLTVFLLLPTCRRPRRTAVRQGPRTRVSRTNGSRSP